MRRRSRAREFALQMLYQIEISHEEFEVCKDKFWDQDMNEPDSQDFSVIRDFANQLVKKVLQNLKVVDIEIERCAANWKMSRMALVDRNILRIGTCEILLVDDVPSKVAINEAIELAKKYGDLESSKFVNGILDKVAKDHKPCD